MRSTLTIEIEHEGDHCGGCLFLKIRGPILKHRVYCQWLDAPLVPLQVGGKWAARDPQCTAEAQPVEDASVPVLILDDGSRIPLTGEIAELARKAIEEDGDE